MKIKLIASALALVASLAGQASAAQLAKMPADADVVKKLLLIDPGKFQRVTTMPMAMKGKGCTFYENENGGGEKWHKAVGWLAQRYDSQDSYAEYVTTVGPWWNDKISSIQCDDSEKVHCSVAVYPDDNKGGGDEAIFWGSQGLVNLSNTKWNDSISSYMMFCNLMK